MVAIRIINGQYCTVFDIQKEENTDNNIKPTDEDPGCNKKGKKIDQMKHYKGAIVISAISVVNIAI